MTFLKLLLKSLFIVAALAVFAFPFIMEYVTYRRDKKRGLTYKRFWTAAFSILYAVGITVAIYLLRSAISWLGSLSWLSWLAGWLAVSSRLGYFCSVMAVILINFGIGMLYRLFSKMLRIRHKKRSLVKPEKKSGKFSLFQRIERKVIKFFFSETWFFVKNIIGFLSVALSAVYLLVFLLYTLPAVFGASWLPYGFINNLFLSGYVYPSITLLVLWECYFFLSGIELVEEECPELVASVTTLTDLPVDIAAIDAKVKEEFIDYFACELDISAAIKEDVSTTDHHPLTKYIAAAVEHDARNPEIIKEVYLTCTDKLVESNTSLAINGNFFSEFSMYFFRYLSIIIARGDNVVFICNDDKEIDTADEYIRAGLSQISSIYCKDFGEDAVDFDHPIWKIVKISGEKSTTEEAKVDDSNILVTSLSYLCSSRFETEQPAFASCIDTVVFVDVQKTVNTYHRQLSILNTRLKHLARLHALEEANRGGKENYLARYASRQVRYLCFCDDRTAGLDKILKNMLSVELESADAMHYNAQTLVRCYKFEGTPDADGVTACPQYFHTDENVGVIMNMAVLCLNQGAGNVSIYADDLVPYENYAETIAANMGLITDKPDEDRLRINSHHYNPDNYSVIIAMDSHDNLPELARRCMAFASDKPTLIILFSRPYMLRDYYYSNLNELWLRSQVERIPVKEGGEREIAQKIVIKAMHGGISISDIIKLAKGNSVFDRFTEKSDVSGVLRYILELYGIPQKKDIDVFASFEYNGVRAFDDNGKYYSIQNVVVKRDGVLQEKLNARNMIKMVVEDEELLLHLPNSRLTQNYIAGQNLLHNGIIYTIQKIDVSKGEIFARLAVGGLNDEVYKYIQCREYRLWFGAEPVEDVLPPTYCEINEEKDGLKVERVDIRVFRTPMEVVTDGYYKLNPHTLAQNKPVRQKTSIMHEGNDLYARQTYRSYGEIPHPAFSSNGVIAANNLRTSERGALAMSIKFKAKLGDKAEQIMFLASVMLGEVLKSMFPSVADSVAVCYNARKKAEEDEADIVTRLHPGLTVCGEREPLAEDEHEIMIIEDCPTDLGVLAVLMTSGSDVLKTLFNPVFKYLEWYRAGGDTSDYLYFGSDKEPACFAFAPLYTLAKIIGDDGHKHDFRDLAAIKACDVCDFCGKKYAKGSGDVKALEDGRLICKTCAGNIVANNKKSLQACLLSAKRFIESTYGVKLDDEYEFCFDSTVKIMNTLKRDGSLTGRGRDVPLYSYVDTKGKKIHVETDIPMASLAELLARELTYTWQLKNIPALEEALAEGHIALVGIQYLKFLGHNEMARARAAYYESNTHVSGEGYRMLLRGLMENPVYGNNPFAYLLGGLSGEGEEFVRPKKIVEIEDFGPPYVPSAPDRALDGNVNYYYKSRMAATHQAAYDTLLAAIKAHAENVTLPGFSSDVLSGIVKAVEYDHPELFWYKSITHYPHGVHELHYGCTAEEAEVLQRRIDAATEAYLEGIDDKMSAYDVAIRLHYKLIQNVDYDSIALKKEESVGGPDSTKIDYLRTVCGVLLNGKAVCEGYARTLQYLLHKCGIESTEIAGHVVKETGELGELHAWNLVKIDGDYYYMDVTWDDQSNTAQTVKNSNYGFDYFCITTDELTRTRLLDYSPGDIDRYIATKANYHHHVGAFLDAYDLEKIKSIAAAYAKGKSNMFTFKCKNKALHDECMRKLFVEGNDCFTVLKAARKEDKRINDGSYSYCYNNDLYTVTVYFKYE